MKLAPKFATRRFPHGAYWICDPCCAYPERRLGSFCDHADDIPGVIEIDGEEMFVWHTAFGDGIYNVAGPKCGSVGVDSGTLAVIPASLVEKWGTTDALRRYEAMGIACSIRTARNFTITEEEGNIFFLDYCVDTSGFLDGPERE